MFDGNQRHFLVAKERIGNLIAFHDTHVVMRSAANEEHPYLKAKNQLLYFAQPGLCVTKNY
jgi:hypothetical protein